VTNSNGLQTKKEGGALLDPELLSDEIAEFEEKLKNKVIGQDRAIRNVVNAYKVCLAGLTAPGKPINNLLFLGPTGSGKTRIVEAAAEILFGSPTAFLKIDCAEFQHSHEIAKLIGSPPGYIGHKETPPIFTETRLSSFHTEKLKMTFVLFDEIEKAHASVWQLLLSVLDKATLTLGDNSPVDFSRCIIFMTSNLGGKNIVNLVSGDQIGFAPHKAITEITDPDVDSKIYRVALEAAKHEFPSEFMNRIDRIVVFRTLTHEHLREILDIEINNVQERILASKPEQMFVITVTNEAKEFLLREGTDFKYGARHLKRAIERHLIYPLSNLVTTKQIESGDTIKIGFDSKKNKLNFKKEKK